MGLVLVDDKDNTIRSERKLSNQCEYCGVGEEVNHHELCPESLKEEISFLKGEIIRVKGDTAMLQSEMTSMNDLFKYDLAAMMRNMANNSANITSFYDDTATKLEGL